MQTQVNEMTDPVNPASIDINDPTVKELIESQINTAIAGLKSKNQELIEEKKKLKAEIQEFDGLDKATLKSYIDRLKNDEESRLIAEGKVGEVIDRRTERMRESYQNQIADNQKAAQDWQNRYVDLEQRFNYSQIDAALRDAAAAANVIPSAVEDLITRGRTSFNIENGKLISKDAYTGEVRIGADGKTPYGAHDFVADLKKVAPHFWPQSQSGGFTGATSGDRVERMTNALNSPGGFAEYLKLKEKLKKA